VEIRVTVATRTDRAEPPTDVVFCGPRAVDLRALLLVFMHPGPLDVAGTVKRFPAHGKHLAGDPDQQRRERRNRPLLTLCVHQQQPRRTHREPVARAATDVTDTADCGRHRAHRANGPAPLRQAVQQRSAVPDQAERQEAGLRVRDEVVAIGIRPTVGRRHP
jgi:hypothetical protein